MRDPGRMPVSRAVVSEMVSLLSDMLPERTGGDVDSSVSLKGGKDATERCSVPNGVAAVVEGWVAA